MTCEISLMNRHAIVLAADSAATVSYWSEPDREWKDRYFKGANKIFQLSTHQPVGIMIYGTASLHDVPWEVIVKDFRSRLGSKSFNDITGYADEFFAFIRGHAHLFPVDYQEKILRDEVEKVAFTQIMFVRGDDSIVKAASDEAKRAAAVALLDRISKDVEALPIAEPFDQSDLDSALGKYRTDLQKEVQGICDRMTTPYVDVASATDLAISTFFKRPTDLMQSTGVVFAGYGDHDFFPTYHEYQCHGLILGKCLAKKGESRTVSLDTPAHIKGFATTDMVNTFQIGFSPDTFDTVRDELRKSLESFAEAIKKDLGHEGEIPKLQERIEDTVKTHTANWTRAARRAHAWPLLRVIGSLAVDEMAELAETLVELQSLKEKVTKPTESVGGPIDVAVISKADGFIWIKRKHYFDPKLNPRFFVRQAESEK
jgi:hypothetical protein